MLTLSSPSVICTVTAFCLPCTPEIAPNRPLNLFTKSSFVVFMVPRISQEGFLGRSRLFHVSLYHPWSSHLFSELQLSTTGESYLLSGLDDVAAPACVLLSGWGIISWWKSPQCAALQSTARLRRGRSDTDRWRKGGRDQGGPESTDLSFSSAVPDGGRTVGRVADRAEETLHQHYFFSAGCYDFVVCFLRPFPHLCVTSGVSVLPSFALHAFQQLFYIVNEFHESYSVISSYLMYCSV